MKKEKKSFAARYLVCQKNREKEASVDSKSSEQEHFKELKVAGPQIVWEIQSISLKSILKDKFELAV